MPDATGTVVASSAPGSPSDRAPADGAAEAGRTGASVAPESARFGALRSRNFRLLWFGLLTSNVGTWMAQTAEGWLVTELAPGRTASALGLIAVAFAVPMLLLPPIGGALADRVPRLRLLRLAQVTYLVMSGTLAVLTLAGWTTTGVLVLFAFGNGVVLAFDNPTRQALLPDLVERDRLTSAVSLNASVFTGAALVGPALAGALIPLVGVGGVFVVNCLSYLVVLRALRRIEGVPERSGRAGNRTGGIVATIGGGLAYVRRTPLVASLLLLSLISGLFGRSYGVLLPVFAREEFGLGSVGFGFLVAAPGLGTLAGSLGLAARGELHRKGRWMLGATLAFCLLLGLFALGRAYALALPLLALAGAATTVASALVATSIHLVVPGELRGRVMSLYTLTLIGMPSLGALGAGALGDWLGVRIAVGTGAALVAGLTLLLFARRPELRDEA